MMDYSNREVNDRDKCKSSIHKGLKIYQKFQTNGWPERNKPLMKIYHILHSWNIIVSVYPKQAMIVT